jgi:hypothetical protein
MYVAPWQAPTEYIGRTATLATAGAWHMFFHTPADIAATESEVRPVLIGLGIAALVAVTLAAMRLGQIRVLVLALGWFGICVLPEGGAETSGRLLMPASVGGCVLAGAIAGGCVERAALLRKRRAWALLIFGHALLVCGLVISPALLVMQGQMFSARGAKDRTDIGDAMRRFVDQPGLSVIVLNHESSLAALSFGPTAAVRHEPAPAAVYSLQGWRRSVTIVREDERTLRLTFHGDRLPPMHRFESVTLIRGDLARFQAMARDATWIPLGTEAEVLFVEAGDSGVRTLRFRTRKPLEDDAYRLLHVRDGRYELWAPPAVGAEVRLPSVPSRAVWF